MGYTVTCIVPGDGRTFPKRGDTVTVHYIGILEDGTKFDSSRDRGCPFKIAIGMGNMIKGWDEGVLQMSLGERSLLVITSDHAYGHRGFGLLIPLDSNLIFEVELLEISRSLIIDTKCSPPQHPGEESSQ